MRRLPPGPEALLPKASGDMGGDSQPQGGACLLKHCPSQWDSRDRDRQHSVWAKGQHNRGEVQCWTTGHVTHGKGGCRQRMGISRGKALLRAHKSEKRTGVGMAKMGAASRAQARALLRTCSRGSLQPNQGESPHLTTLCCGTSPGRRGTVGIGAETDGCELGG